VGIAGTTAGTDVAASLVAGVGLIVVAGHFRGSNRGRFGISRKTPGSDDSTTETITVLVTAIP